jgi:hypothetical protein
MTNITKEKELELVWLENEDGSMSYEEFAYKVVTGIEECEGYCASKQYSHFGVCRCIREAFPSFQFYELYLHYREKLTDTEKAVFFANMLNLPKSGKD